MALWRRGKEGIKYETRTKIALATAAIGLTSMPTAANAALTVEGVTYDLILNSVSGNTGNFTLAISGVNTASDTRKGRTGIDSFAFNDPSVGDATSGTSAGFNFLTGGLNSNGCNGNGNFFCFDNTSYTLVLGAGGTTSINFAVTSNAVGSWTNYAGDFKINWTGNQNNYDLVSQVIQSRPPAVPEPATWAMMLVGFGGIGMAMRRRKVNVRLAQVA